MIQKRAKKHLINVVLFAMGGVYLLTILSINFAKNPNFYCTDMYSDMCYAEKVWEQKKLFPDGWVFGNQLYAVATPVVASVFYSMTQDHCMAMGAATVLMGLGVLLSFDWMMKPLFPDRQSRLAGIVAFLALVLFCGNPIHAINGWQLFFTMCSYYACYAIAAFLAFGCYVRSDTCWSWRLTAMMIFTCILSFGTGVQSLRQTAVMVCPLLAVQALHMIRCAIDKEKMLDRSLAVTGMITISNLAGVVYSKMADANQVEIFGEIGMVDFRQIPTRIVPGFSKIVSLMLPVGDILAILVLLVGSFIGLYTIYVLKRSKNEKAVICLLLFAISIAGIFAIDVFLTMQVRSIYYFLLYPMIAFIIAALYASGPQILRYGILFFLIVLLVFNCVFRILPVLRQADMQDDYEEVADYLENAGISTVYSSWNHGEKIGISSDWNIQVGFWDSMHTPFTAVTYLCDPGVFDVDPSECAYLFFGMEEVSAAMEKAGESLSLVKHFPQSDVYVFTSKVNLMDCK